MEERFIEAKETIHDKIRDSLIKNNTKEAIEELDNFLRSLPEKTVVIISKRTNNMNSISIENVNKKFIEYNDALKNGNETTIQESLNSYLDFRLNF